MAASTHHLETASAEPAVRTITRVISNLRNPVVAEEYKRQRQIIHDAASRQNEEMRFWESSQSDEGWV